MRVLTAAQMRRIDQRAIQELGIPGLVLMENAALGVVEAVAERFPQAESIAIFCGPGNNGGDGLAVGRLLATRGYDVELFLAFGDKEPSGDAARQLEICRRLSLSLNRIRDEGNAIEAVASTVRSADLLVDALFGTGLSRSLGGMFAALVSALTDSPTPVLAVDLPSGLDASLSTFLGPHVEAQCTVTFAAPKVAHIFSPAAGAVGELVVTDLGFPLTWSPEEVPEEDSSESLHLLLQSELAAYVLPRSEAGHKGTFGHLLLCAGSPGKSGAAILAARAAVRGGAGLVTVAVPEPLLDLVDAGSLESMTVPLAAEGDGILAAAAAEAWLQLVEGKAALAVGPGLGSSLTGENAIREMVLKSTLPLVLDADGINAFAGRASDLSQRQGPLVITPHPGELARLLGVAIPRSAEQRCAAAAAAARETHSVVVLKGHQTLVATPEGQIFVNTTGNAGMATGGSGDVLTGLIGALLAQGYSSLVAAQLGVYLHGEAGDRVVQHMGEAALAANDLVEQLGAALSGVASA